MSTIETSNRIEAAGRTRGSGVTPRLSPLNLEVTVIFTNAHSTLRAIKAAGRLAAGLGAELRIIVPRINTDVIRWPFLTESSLRWPHFRTVVGGEKINTRIDVRCCQDRWQMLQRELAPCSIVVLGGSSRWWWPTAEKRIFEKLRAAGHAVLFCQD